MEIKTDVRVSLELHFTSDDLANSLELARLAAVCDGLSLLMKAGRHDDNAVEGVPTVPAIAATQAQAEPEESTPDLPGGRQMPASRKWSFEQFDAAVRAEMQRLAGPGQMPTTTIWDRERSPDLPTLTGVIRRYEAKNLADMAARLGLQPAGVRPGPKAKAAPSNNGVAGRHL